MIMPCFFCVANSKFNNIKYDTTINIQNKTQNVSSILLINDINMLRRIINRLFK